MAFRNDDVAARARVDVLERENATLRDELEARTTAQGAPRRRALGAWVVSGLGLLAILASWYAAFVVSGYVGERVGVVLVALAVLLLSAGALLGVLSRLMHVVPPSEALVLSGRRQAGPDGRVVGYRVITGGRVLRLPIIERADRMDLRPLRFELEVQDAYAKGNARVTLHVRGSARIGRDRRILANAIERYLGRDREEIALVLRETIEGHVRQVAAMMTTEELAQDTELVAERLLETGGEDLEKLGLTLDQLQILDVR